MYKMFKCANVQSSNSLHNKMLTPYMPTYLCQKYMFDHKMCRMAVPQGCSTKGIPLGARQFPANSVSRRRGAYKRGGGQRIGEKASG